MNRTARLSWKLGLVAVLALVATLVFTVVFSSRIASHAAGVSSHHTTIYTYKTHVVNDPDSGTCGITWANDQFDRIFTVNAKNTAVFSVQFKNGSFVTVGGPSPNACASGTNNGSTVAAGVVGTLSGSYTNVVVTGGTFNPHATCNNTTCGTTAGFVATVYGPTATYNVITYDFNYSTADNGGATQDSSNVGGYNGDITGGVVGSDSHMKVHSKPTLR